MALTVLAVLLLVAVITVLILVGRNRSLQRRVEDVLSQASNREKNAVAKSRVGHVAKITEQLAPLLPGFPDYNVKDVQWVGGAVDMIVWDGLEDGREVNVVLLDIKTGRASVNTRQRKIRAAVDAGRVTFKIFPFRPEQAAVEAEVTGPLLDAAVTGEELDVGLIQPEPTDAEDGDSGWEDHIGDHVTYAADPPTT